MVLRLLGALWLAPIALPIWVLFVLPVWGLGLLGDPKYRHWAIVWAVYHHHRYPWWSRRWSGWTGLALPFAPLINVPRIADRIERTERHELRHCDQWLVLGPLFPVVYGVLTLVYGYQNNPMERDAVKAERG